MTELPERTASAAKRLALVTLLAGILVALLGFFAPPASAAQLLRPETRVAALAEPNGQFVGPHDSVLAVQGRERTPNYDQPATGSSVAAEGGTGATLTGAADAPVGATEPGETFVRTGASPENLNFTFDTPGGVQPGTFAFPESTFNEIGEDPAALKNLGDLPGEPPTVFRTLEPPAGTPIQRGIVPGGMFGGEGGVPEVFFPEGF